ncbi:Wzz/FepE/Etk N-terminal domain-containing protein [Photobacterium sp.]|uniref:Wzz/FepE/Etk N-terminal domain-containing protein n=1 Tax=Photobacterium sp. TaxID=660 RepID=UPI00299E1FF8|nr:Wzz/FepE/Etk N-terminal domain-containing protein [Photobacterium sp.]MDX1303677.1 Wzz/FepE/Etk N-terminal domain-containing protein [Photobacterium sp.]
MDKPETIPPTDIKGQNVIDNQVSLNELISYIWKHKILLVVTTFIVTLLSVVYAFMAEETWSSNAVIIEPQISNFSSYRNQVKKYQPIFDISQEDGTILISKELDDLVNPSLLFQSFLSQFNSSSNKQKYLNGNNDFLKVKNTIEKNDLYEDNVRRLYTLWYKKLNAEQLTQKNLHQPLTINASANNRDSSFNMLNEYINFVTKKSNAIAFNNLHSVVSNKKNELEQQKLILLTQAGNRLEVEKARTKYSLNIARSAGAVKPLSNFGSDELFSINLGSDALSEKLNSLENIKNLSIIEPKLQQVNARLTLITQMPIANKVEFKPFSFLQDVEKPLNRSNPKRPLIVLLGLIFGFIISVLVITTKHAIKNK